MTFCLDLFVCAKLCQAHISCKNQRGKSNQQVNPIQGTLYFRRKKEKEYRVA